MLRNNEKVRDSLAQKVYEKLTESTDTSQSSPARRILRLDDKELALFLRLCERFHAEENTLFIRDYFKAPFSSDKKDSYQKLYDDYIKNDAKFKINIDDDLRMDFEQFVTDGKLNMEANEEKKVKDQSKEILLAYKKIYDVVASLVYNDVVRKKSAGSLLELLQNAEDSLNTNLTISNQKR